MDATLIYTGTLPSSPAAGPLEQAPPEPLRRKPAKTRRGCRSASAAAVRHGPLPRKYPVRLYTMFTGLKNDRMPLRIFNRTVPNG